MNRIALIRIRGGANIRKDVEQTMRMLHLFNKHSCAILKSTGSNMGMIFKIKDCVTWGEIDKDTFKTLLKNRARLQGNKRMTENYLKEKLNLGIDEFVKDFLDFKRELKDIPGLKPFFRLKPPTKGFERGGIKTPFSLGGVLGYRKGEINKLIMRMI